jgi:hypothetical protein
VSAKQERWFQAADKRRKVAGLLCGLFLGVLALAQFETLHRWLHPQAGQPAHQCAVTMLQSGQVEASPGVEFVAVPPLRVFAEQPVDYFFTASVGYSLPHGRGPPAILL